MPCINRTERHTVLRPAVGTIVQIEEGVFLLETEPRLVLGVKLHELGALVAVVVLVGGTVGIPAFGQHEDICRWLALCCERCRIKADGLLLGGRKGSG